MYLSSGRGRKSGGARATGATPSLAPLHIPFQMILTYHCNQTILKDDLTKVLILL